MNHRQVSDEKAKYHSIKSIAAILLRPKTMAISPLLPPNGRPQEMRAAQLLRRCGLRLVSAIAGIIAVPPAAAGIHSRVRRPRRALGLREAVTLAIPRCDGRSRVNRSATRNEAPAHVALRVVPCHAAPGSNAIDYTYIRSGWHRTDDVKLEAWTAAQIEIVGQCCCRDRACRKEQGADGK